MLLVVLMILPTLTSVRNAVPVPVTVLLPNGTEMVPERCVFGQAVASQVPDATLVISRLTALACSAGNTANSIIRMVRSAAVLYIRVLVLVFVFIVLLSFDRGWRMDSSPAITNSKIWTCLSPNCFRQGSCRKQDEPIWISLQPTLRLFLTFCYNFLTFC